MAPIHEEERVGTGGGLSLIQIDEHKLASRIESAQ